MLDKIVKVSTLISAFLIFCGILKMILYYSAFKINIIQFLTLPEIIISFLDDMNVLMLIFFLMILQTLTTIGVIKLKTGRPVFDLLGMISEFALKHKYRYAVFFFILIGATISLLYFELIAFNYLSIYCLLFAVLQFWTMLFLVRDISGDIGVPDDISKPLGVLTIVLGIFLLAQHDINETRRFSQQVFVTVGENVINCNSATGTMYVGKTEDYVFFFNSKELVSSAIPSEKVNKYEFR